MTQPSTDASQEPVLNMKCRKCPSIEAVEKPYTQNVRMYVCVKCQAPSFVNVGGTSLF